MKILIDMNLSPGLCPLLEQSGWPAIHWSDVGNRRATDREIMRWAVANGYVVLTHDLDFGAALAATQAPSPSVVQVRTQDVLPHCLAPLLGRAIRENAAAIEAGALIVVNESRARVRILPLRP